MNPLSYGGTPKKFKRLNSRNFDLDFQAGQEEVIPLIRPPKMVALNEMFRKIPLLSSSVVTLKIIQTTLERFEML